jgi:hypothetical protein
MNATAAAVFNTRNASEIFDNRDRKPTFARNADKVASA